MHSSLWLLGALHLLVSVAGMLPQSPVHCDGAGSCNLFNSYGVWNDRKDCHVPNVTYPTTENELLRAVAYANQNKLKLKVVSQFSHTITKSACPATSIGNSLLISTSSYNSGIEIDQANLAVTVDSGVGLRKLIDTVEAAGLSLVAAPYWEGASVGGLISTGSHGSSWWGKGGSVHDHIVGLSLIVPAKQSEGYAKILRLQPKDELFNAAIISLGLLGVISKVKLSLEKGFKRSITYDFTDDDHIVGLSLIVPAKQSEGYAKILRLQPKDELFNAAIISLGLLGVISKVKLSLEKGFKRSITYDFTDDDHIEDKYIDHGKKYEFADITWYPSKHTAAYRYDNRVPLSVSGDGVYDFLGFQANSILVSKSVRASEKSMDNGHSLSGKCILASSFLAYKKLVANGLKNGLTFTGYPVIGNQGKMQTSGSCLYSTGKDNSCAWDPRINGLFFYETTAIFPAPKFRDFILDVKKLRDMVKPENFCGVDIYNGFLIRFIKASEAYLGQPEDSVVVDFNYYRADDASTPRFDQDVWEEVEQLAFFKHGAKPHWAKNRNIAFLNVQNKYSKFNKFVGVKRQLDPQNMFSSEWSDEVVYGKQGAKSDGCGLEGMCICSEDRHCSPGKGYLCKPGLVYDEARVCRYSPSSNGASDHPKTD